MAQQYINIGTAPNDGAGDPIRTAFGKTNNNFSQLFSIPQSSPPPTLIGSPGDFAGMYAYSSSYFYYCFSAYDGVSTIWAELSNSGNVTATAILNGTSNVSIPTANSNVSVGVNGTANVAVFSNIGLLVTGVVSASGNVRGGNLNSAGQVSAAGNITGNYIFGNGSQLTGLPATYGNANVSAFLPTYTGNLYPTAIYTNNYLYANGQPFGGGSGNYSNANVAAYLPTYSGNIGAGNVSATGNITGNYILGNGSQLTGLSATYGNANVAAYLPTYNGNLSPGNLNVINSFTIGGTPFTRTLTVGTRLSPVTVPLATNNSFNVVGRTGNVTVYTT
jgi:hypothetical protein